MNQKTPCVCSEGEIGAALSCYEDLTYLDTFEDLIITNDAPLDSDAHIVRQLLEGVPQRISILEERIESLSVILDRLRLERRGLKKREKKLRPILSPARRVPNELLARIFEISCAAYYCDDDNADTTDLESPPWGFTRVCRRWKDIALSLPKLWTFIRLPDVSTAPKTYAPLMQRYLSRSGDLPLSIDVVWDDIELEPPARNLLKQIMLHASRWASVEFEFETDLETVTSAFNEIPGTLLALEVLRLTGLSCWPAEEVADLAIHAFGEAPRLREVSFKAVADFAENLAIPWSQITHFTCVEVTPGDMLNVLRHMSALEVCNLAYSFGYPDNSTSPVDVTVCLPRLRKLVLGDNGVDQILEDMTLPALQDLSLWASWYSLCYFTDLLSRSGSACHLQRLHLKIPFTPDTTTYSSAISLLERAAGAVTHLRVQDFVLSKSRHSKGQILTALARSESPLVPHLEHLHLHVCASNHADDLIIPILETRWAKVSPDMVRLRTLRLYINKLGPSLRDDTVSLLERYRGEGLDWEVEYNSSSSEQFDFK